MDLNSITGAGNAGAPSRLFDMMRSGAMGSPAAMPFAGAPASRPDPDQALSEHGVSLDQLSSVADALGTDTETLTDELGEDASMRDLMTRARDSGVAPGEMMQALATDLGGAGVLGGPFGGGSGGPFGGVVGSMPPMFVDTASGDPTGDLLTQLFGDDAG